MKHPGPFDILCADLSGGVTTLVEASAGTGKTYAIVGIFLRLIAETDVGVENILVVTYTDAATQELKGKIRTALRKAATALRDQAGTGDAVIDGLLKTLEKVRAVAVRRLLRALVAFDQAAIFTIHGFCNRMLCEFAFESGTVFDAELVTNQDELKRQVAQDFWRRYFYDASPLFVDYAVRKKRLSPEKLAGLLERWMVFPDLRVVPDAEESVDTTEPEQAFADSLAQVASEWQAHKEDIQAILKNSAGLHRNKYRPASLPVWFEQMDAYVNTREGFSGTFEKFEKFTSSGIQDGTKSGAVVEPHPFFATCERHMEAAQALSLCFDRRMAVEKSRFLEYARTELAARKQLLNIHYFDDLLLNLDRVLASGAGTGLIEKARNRYRAVLIDEFQDTDPLQYRIFSSMFRGAAALFLIGDPKQAIYGFRGADVFAYLEAAPEADAAYTLRENWRSDTGLVRGVNTLFQTMASPFVFERINFHPVMPAAESRVPRLMLQGRETSTLEIRVFDESGFSHVSTKDRWTDVVARETASRVARLAAMGKNGEALLGDRPLLEADMAVLVRKNAEAMVIQEHLSRLHVHSTILKAGDLFGSREAFEMQVLLSAVAFAHDERLVRGACATQMMGRRQALTAEADGMGEIVERFLAYRETWRRHGFMKMLHQVVHGEKVMPRLMGFSDGERRCTNLFHLAELLHKTALEQHYGPERLVRWLMRQRTGPQDGNEEHQLRLESDDSAVKIITIHKSKGLEYPVTFCPFLWTAGPRDADTDGLACHEKEHGRMTMVLDLRTGDDDSLKIRREQWRQEQSAENMRLLYVALTRAKNQCYVSVPVGKAQGSSLAALLGAGAAEEITVEGLESLAARSEGAIRVTRVSPADLVVEPVGADKDAASRELSRRRFSGKIAADWRVTSFSSMRRAAPDAEEEHVAGEDAGLETAFPLPAVSHTGIEHFPAGARAGLFMHELFERLDFTRPEPAYREALVAEKLARYNFDRKWLVPVCDMVERVLSVELPVEGQKAGIQLSSVPAGNRINELEFFFPLRPVSPQTLAAAYRKAGADAGGGRFPEAVGALEFSPARGFMRGFIDLVFFSHGRYFIVDWKSNLLGPTTDAYCQENLREIMGKEYYLLQAHLYAVALNQYLATRVAGYDYESDFGGIYYIFLRGVDAAAGPAYGIYREKPSVTLMSGLTRCLIQQKSGSAGRSIPETDAGFFANSGSR